MQYANALLALVLLASPWAGRSQKDARAPTTLEQSVASPCAEVPKPDRKGSEDYIGGFHDGYVAGCKAMSDQTKQRHEYGVDEYVADVAAVRSYEQQNQALLNALSHYCASAGRAAREDTANMSSFDRLKYLVARLTDLVTRKYQCIE